MLKDKFIKNKKLSVIVIILLLLVSVGLGVYLKERGTEDAQPEIGNVLPVNDAEQLEEPDLQDGKESVSSPSGQFSSQFKGNPSGNADLMINNEIIANNVIHFNWSDDDNLFFVQLGESQTLLKSYNPSLQISTELLTVDKELLGFELMNDSLVYTTETEVGFIMQNGTDKKVLLTFNKPISGRDSGYVPDIILSEDKASVTVEILDENYLETAQIRYLIINNKGEIIGDSILSND